MKCLIVLVHELHTEFKRLRTADTTLQLGTDPKLLTVGDVTICKIGGTITKVVNNGGKRPSFPPATDIVGLFLNNSSAGPYPHETEQTGPTLFVDSYKYLTGFKPELYCSYVEK